MRISGLAFAVLGLLFVMTAAPAAVDVCTAQDTAAATDLIAVEQFTGENADPALIGALAVTLRKELKNLGYNVMDEEHMAKALSAQDIKKEKDYFDPVKAAALAKTYGAKKIVVGKLSVKETVINISSMLVEAETGKKLQGTEETYVGGEQKLKEDIQKLAYKLAKTLTQPGGGVSSSSVKPGASSTAASPAQPNAKPGEGGVDTSSRKPAPAPKTTTPPEPQKDDAEKEPAKTEGTEKTE